MACGRRTGDGVACAHRQGDTVELHDGNGNACGVARNVRGDQRVAGIVRLQRIGAVAQRHGFTVNGQGKFVLVGHRKGFAAVIDACVGDPVKYRRLGVGCLHIAAAAELFVGTGVPLAGVLRVRNDADIRGDRHAAVDDYGGVDLLQSQTLVKAVDEAAADGDIAESGVALQRGVGALLDGCDLDGAGANGEGASGLGRNLTSIHAVCKLQRSAGLGDYAAFADEAVDGQLTAAIYSDRAVGSAVQQRGRAADAQSRSGVQCAAGQGVQALAADGIPKAHIREAACSDAVDGVPEFRFRCSQRATLGAHGLAADDAVGCAAEWPALISGDGQLRALCNGDIAAHRAAFRYDQREGAGFHGQRFLAVAQQGQRAVPVFLGLRRCEGVCRRDVAGHRVVLADERAQSAVAVPAEVIVAHVPHGEFDGVVTHLNGDDKKVGTDLVVLVGEPDAIAVGARGGKAAEREGQIHCACGGNIQRFKRLAAVAAFQHCGDLSGGGVVQRTGKRDRRLSAVFLGACCIEYDHARLLGNDQRRFHDGNVVDPVGVSLDLHIAFLCVTAVRQSKGAVIFEVFHRGAAGAENAPEAAALQGQTFPVVRIHTAQPGEVAAGNGQMAACAGINGPAASDLAAAGGVEDRQIAAVRDTERIAADVQRLSGEVKRIAARVQPDAAAADQRACVCFVKGDVLQELHRAAVGLLGKVDRTRKGVKPMHGSVFLHGNGKLHSAVGAVVAADIRVLTEVDGDLLNAGAGRLVIGNIYKPAALGQNISDIRLLQAQPVIRAAVEREILRFAAGTHTAQQGILARVNGELAHGEKALYVADSQAHGKVRAFAHRERHENITCACRRVEGDLAVDFDSG